MNNSERVFRHLVKPCYECRDQAMRQRVLFGLSMRFTAHRTSLLFSQFLSHVTPSKKQIDTRTHKKWIHIHPTRMHVQCVYGCSHTLSGLPCTNVTAHMLLAHTLFHIFSHSWPRTCIGSRSTFEPLCRQPVLLHIQISRRVTHLQPLLACICVKARRAHIQKPKAGSNTCARSSRESCKLF